MCECKIEAAHSTILFGRDSRRPRVPPTPAAGAYLTHFGPHTDGAVLSEQRGLARLCLPGDAMDGALGKQALGTLSTSHYFPLLPGGAGA